MLLEWMIVISHLIMLLLVSSCEVFEKMCIRDSRCNGGRGEALLIVRKA